MRSRVGTTKTRIGKKTGAEDDGPWRHGRVHVLEDQCSTCIFRPGNVMHLPPGRLATLVGEALKEQSSINCHETLHDKRAVCRGFFDIHKTEPLRLAEAMGLLAFDPVPCTPARRMPLKTLRNWEPGRFRTGPFERFVVVDLDAPRAWPWEEGWAAGKYPEETDCTADGGISIGTVVR